MKKFSSIALLFFSLAFLAVESTSCVKKGESDPIISLRTRTSRLTGDWAVQSIRLNERVDLMNYWVPGVSELCQMEFYNHFETDSKGFLFHENGTVNVSEKTRAQVFDQDSCVSINEELTLDQLETWSFNEDETTLIITNDAGTGTTFDEFDIVGLSNNELILSFEVVCNFELNTDGSISSYAAPKVYTATMTLEKSE